MNFCLTIFDLKENRYSINALLSALEKEILIEEIPIYFFKNKSALLKGVEELLEKFEKIIIAFSFFTTQLWDINDVIKTLQKTFASKRKKLILIAGGPHPTGDIKGVLNWGFDFVFTGEAEKSFSEFIRTLKFRENFSQVKGLAYLNENKEFIYTGKSEKINLNSYPPFSLKLNRLNPIEITRGCPFGCYFCQTPRIFGKKVRHRSIENILKYVELLLERGIKDFRFITPNAFSYGSIDGKTLNLEALETLLKELHQLVNPMGGRIFFGSFPSEVRPEHVTEETVNLVKKYANNDNLVIGAQSGSDRILKLCKRGHTVEDIYRAVKLTIKAGLKAKVDFIFGLPEEKKEDIKETIKVMEDLAKMGAIIHAHTFMPLPQTPFVKKKPGKIDLDLLKTINKLLGKGLLFGDWKIQEELAEKIYRYFQTGKIEECIKNSI
ncbi:Radical SAM domain protein [Thermodesulfobacterium geofontis OPF15]|uniref:Radical SAM domain protein n=1 Tax=Thermodesulfobacterium geofontis (strain OPF15) TaxID=795359 RepID=F8C2G5_THEGP|nr:TIGR04013 family B12-binding domain/radical SAM domain-containing protein [Thermodesulfobacterium geofontis]AEH22255.1 Radical SAM domain protein [Thermodesulfobacterium geofontis OPF15]